MLETESRNSKMTRTQYNSISRAQTARFRTTNLDFTEDNKKLKEVVSAKTVILLTDDS